MKTLTTTLFVALSVAMAIADVPPSVSRISPELGPAGQWVYVHGTNFVSEHTIVAVGGKSNITAHVYNGTQLGFRIPPGAEGTSVIIVKTPSGSASSANSFTIGVPPNPPTVTRITPNLGPVGQWVYVSGTEFVNGKTTVSVGGTSDLPAHVYTPTSLGFSIPEDAADTGTIRVTTPNGLATSTDTFTVGIPMDPPTVTNITPTLGPVGQWVYVSGTEFVNGKTSVSLDGFSEVRAHVYTPTALGFSIPEGAAGASAISVTTPNGTSTSGSTFTVGVAPSPPSVTGIKPTLGPVGQWVYVSGTEFTCENTTVSFGDLSGIPAVVYSSTSLGFSIPENTTGVNTISVKTANGMGSSAVTFTVGVPQNPPTVATISPTLGPVGQWVYVSGTEFVNGETSVSVGGTTDLLAHVYTPTSLGFSIPTGAVGSSTISITTPNGTATSTDTFTVGIPRNPPTVTGIRPSSGPVGQWVYLSGTEFVNGKTSVSVGGSEQVRGHVYSPTSLGFSIPEGAEGACTISVTTPNGTVSSHDSLTVSNQLETPSIPSNEERVNNNQEVSLEAKSDSIVMQFRMDTKIAELPHPFAALSVKYREALVREGERLQAAGDLRGTLDFRREIDGLDNFPYKFPPAHDSDNPSIERLRQIAKEQKHAPNLRWHEAAVAIKRAHTEDLRKKVEDLNKEGNLNDARWFQSELAKMEVQIGEDLDQIETLKQSIK